jgi:hypothetical protein
MKSVTLSAPARWLRFCIVFLGLAVSVSADQVEMQNGDRYVGKVLTLNNETLVLQNEVLGTVKLPRVKVAAIILLQKPPLPLPACKPMPLQIPVGWLPS